MIEIVMLIGLSYIFAFTFSPVVVEVMKEREAERAKFLAMSEAEQDWYLRRSRFVSFLMLLVLAVLALTSPHWLDWMATLFVTMKDAIQ